MDGRTDRQTELRWLRHAIAVPAVGRKNRRRISTTNVSPIQMISFVVKHTPKIFFSNGGAPKHCGAQGKLPQLLPILKSLNTC